MRDLLRIAIRFCGDVSEYTEPFAILHGLDESLRPAQIMRGIHVMGAWYWPAVNPTSTVWVQGKTVFMLAMDGLITDYLASVKVHGLSATTLLARRKSSSYTLTEATREVRPTGDGRWLIRLLRKHEIRDCLYYPMVRWTFAYRSAQRIELSPEVRGLLGMTASAAIGQIERLNRFPAMASKQPLTARELELLALASTGLTAAAIAAKLDISSLTVRRHFQNILRKLGAKNIAHAVAEAIRQGLII